MSNLPPIKPRSGHYCWFRCEPMSLCQLFLQNQSVYHITSLLGELGICQFRDLNTSINAFQRKFVAEIRRCIEMERKIAFFEKEITRDGIEIIKCVEEPSSPSLKDIGRLEQSLEKFEHDLLNENKTRVQLKHRLLSMIEYRLILKHAEQFYSEAQNPEGDNSKAQKMLRRLSVVDPKLLRRFSMQMAQNDNIPLDPVVDLITLTGTIVASRFISFERMLWRVSRGNILLKRIDIDEKLEDPETGEMQQKCLFILVCQGEKLRDSCKKICIGFHTELYTCPDQPLERQDAYIKVTKEIQDILDVIRQTDEHRKRTLASITQKLNEWQITVIKLKSIYETMNLFNDKVSDQCLIAECWIPDSKISDARLALQQGQLMSDSSVPSALTTILTEETPPTLNVCNKFTAGFQNIVDSYGSCTYGEVNPAPYAIITFPFIFAVMFGDSGHGIIMALFALWMIIKEKQLKSIKDEIFGMFFAGRYIILLMGLFSIYTGAMYNDIFSKSVNLFGTAFNRNLSNATCPGHSGGNGTCELYHLQPMHHLDPNFRYHFGVDPIWQLSTNKVQYLNTYKMKLSVVLGVFQMLFGVILSVFNHLHYRKYISIYVEFIPQIIFLLAIFGYMNFMIFFKWFTYTDKNAGCAPALLITLINMFMFKSPDMENDPCYLTEPMFENQFTLQSVLIIMALLCVPIMLIVKPFYLKYQHKKRLQNSTTPEDRNSFEMTNSSHNNENGAQNSPNNDDSNSTTDVQTDEENQMKSAEVEEAIAKPSTSNDGNGHGHDDNSEFDFGDVFINQAIHTIEYCLGSVSHTASYLRLWALSLAHAQLSEVLWNMIMKNGFMEFKFSGGYVLGAILMYFIFAVWCVLTIAILIVMEGLSAFLHALRLHWVEFMSKFYSGSGQLFQPFSFKTIINQI